MADPDSKTCTKCGETKPLSEYYKQADGVGGVRGDCKACVCDERKRHRAANRRMYAERDQARYIKFREKRKAKSREWYAVNTERARIAGRAHYEANRDTYLAYSAKRKAIKRGAEHQHYTRSEIYERDEGHCKICGCELVNEPHGFDLDHIVPLSLGGADTPWNIQLTCRPCNRSKWANLEGQIHLPV